MPTELLQPNSTKLSMFGSVENKELTEKSYLEELNLSQVNGLQDVS